MNSSAAISLFVRPCAASSATRCSVSVSSSEGGRRPLIRLSSARAFSAQSRAPSSSKTASASLERLAGGFLLLCLPAHDAEAEQRAAALEREADSPPARRWRARRHRERRSQVTLGSSEQSAAARCGGDCPAGSASGRAYELVLLEIAREPGRARRARPASRSHPPTGRSSGRSTRPRAAVRAGRAGSRRPPRRLPSASSKRPSTPRMMIDEDLVRRSPARSQGPSSAWTRAPLDETEIGLDQRLHASHPGPRWAGTASARRAPGLRRRGRARERQSPASHSTSLRDPADEQARSLVASRRCSPLEFLEHGARPHRARPDATSRR